MPFEIDNEDNIVQIKVIGVAAAAATRLIAWWSRGYRVLSLSRSIRTSRPCSVPRQCRRSRSAIKLPTEGRRFQA